MYEDALLHSLAASRKMITMMIMMKIMVVIMMKIMLVIMMKIMMLVLMMTLMIGVDIMQLYLARATGETLI